MIGVAFRVMWRVLIFVLGGMILYVAIVPGYSLLHQRVPFYIAALILYCILAYFALPSLIRLFRLVIKPKHIPLYAYTSDGWASDPINLAIIAKSTFRLQLAFKKAGWFQADPSTFKNMLKEAYALLYKRSYPSAPFSNLYLLGRPFDIGFQKEHVLKQPSPRHRHHVRFWALEDFSEIHPHSSFWQKIFKRFVLGKRKVWIGAATNDTAPFAIRARNGQITHKISSDTDLEREHIIEELRAAGVVKKVYHLKAGEPFSFRGQSFGTNIRCDGYIKVVEVG
jgi:hypothetical protein